MQEFKISVVQSTMSWFIYLILYGMVMSRMHLPGQIQLPVSPSLALDNMGDQGSIGVSVLKRMSMFAT